MSRLLESIIQNFLFAIVCFEFEAKSGDAAPGEAAPADDAEEAKVCTAKQLAYICIYLYSPYINRHHIHSKCIFITHLHKYIYIYISIYIYIYYC